MRDQGTHPKQKKRVILHSSFIIMDNIPHRFRSFKLYLTIPANRRSSLPETMSLIYLPEINGVKIIDNTPAPVTLRRQRSAEAPGEWEAVFASKDKIYAIDGLSFEVYIGEAKALKGTFRRGVRWGLECEAIGLAVWAEISVVTDGGVLMRERVKRRRNRFCPKLFAIAEEDEEEDKEEEDEIEEIGGSDGRDSVEKKGEDGDDMVAKKGISWLNVGIWVACLGVGLFVSRAPLKRLIRLNLF